jgi:integrase
MGRPKLESPNYRLVRRGDRFYVRWWQNSAWQRVSTGETDKRRATIWLAQFVAGRGTPTPPEQPTVSVILDGYLADRKPVVRAYGTLEAAAKALRRHLGDLLPEHLTKERARFYARQRRAEGHMVGPKSTRRKKPTSDGTIIREMVTLRAALKWAKSERWITDVPMIETPRQPPPRDRWLSRDEAARLLKGAAAPHIKIFLAVCLYTGTRAGAALELTWDMIDFTAGLIDFGNAPGGKGRAVVPIASDLLPILTEAHEAATCRFVIEYAGSRVVSVKTGTRAAARRANLHGVTPHILRHTAATWMAMAGVPMIEIAKVLGHRDSATTERVYAKHNPDYLRRAIGALSS